MRSTARWKPLWQRSKSSREASSPADGRRSMVTRRQRAWAATFSSLPPPGTSSAGYGRVSQEARRLLNSRSTTSKVSWAGADGEEKMAMASHAGLASKSKRDGSRPPEVLRLAGRGEPDGAGKTERRKPRLALLPGTRLIRSGKAAATSSTLSRKATSSTAKPTLAVGSREKTPARTGPAAVLRPDVRAKVCAVPSIPANRPRRG